MNRYFYITYKYAGAGFNGDGSYTLETNEYPSRGGIEAYAKEHIEKKEGRPVTVMVNTILEMNEQDFRAFEKGYNQ